METNTVGNNLTPQIALHDTNLRIKTYSVTLVSPFLKPILMMNLNKYPQDDIEHNGFGKKFFSSFDANYSLCKDDGAKHPRLRAKSFAPKRERDVDKGV